MHCNLRQPNAAQSLSALISSPVQRLNSLSLSVAVRLWAFLLLIRRVKLWPWTLTLNIYSLLAVPRSNYVPIWAKSDKPRRCYCSLNIWPYDPEHLSRIALCSGIVCTKFKLRQAIRSWNETIFYANTSWHAMTLTIDSLTLKVFGRSDVTWS